MIKLKKHSGIFILYLNLILWRLKPQLHCSQMHIPSSSPFSTQFLPSHRLYITSFCHQPQLWSTHKTAGFFPLPHAIHKTRLFLPSNTSSLLSSIECDESLPPSSFSMWRTVFVCMHMCVSKRFT